MTYSFTISNVKSSVKLRPPVDFDFVTQRCRELGASCKRFRNLLSIAYKKTSFVLFKSSKRSPNSGQHLNITGCRNTDKTLQAIEDFNYLETGHRQVLDGERLLLRNRPPDKAKAKWGSTVPERTKYAFLGMNIKLVL